MLHLSINNISNSGLTLFQENLLAPLRQQLSKRVVFVALIALGCLTAIYIAYQCCCNSRVYKDTSDREKDIFSRTDKVISSYKEDISSTSFNVYNSIYLSYLNDAISKIKTEDLADSDVNYSSLEEEKKIVKTIKEKWLDDSQEEVKRLLDANIFPKPIQDLLQQKESYENQIYAVVGRVLELKNLYGKSHYVFTHGQSPEISVANQLINEFIRNFTPLLHHPLKIPFRVPHTVTYSENADDFITKYNATASSNYQDNNHNAEMISVDVQFWNTQSCESALDFFTTGSNVNLHRSGELLKIFKSIFSNYLPDDTLCDALAQKAVKIAKLKKSETKVGTLYAICVPKEIIQDDKRNFAYHCHPFGKQCNCFPDKDRIELLEEMQKNKLVKCKDGHYVQYRLLTARLTEEKEVRSFAVDSLPKDKRKFYRNQVKELVKEVIIYSHLYDLIERLEEELSVMEQINSLIESSPQLDPNCIQHLFSVKGLFYQ